MESIISTFHIDWKIIIAQAFNFAVVFGVLYFYALKPLGKLMDERGEKIAKGLTDAKANAETLKQTEKEKEETLNQARIEAQAFVKASKKELETEKTRMLEEARKEAETIVMNGRKTLEADKNKMVEEARGQIASLAMAATEKLLSTKVEPSFNEKKVGDMKHL